MNKSTEEYIHEYLKLPSKEIVDFFEKDASFIMNDVSYGQENVVASDSRYDKCGDSDDDTTGVGVASKIVECNMQIIQGSVEDD